MTENIQNLKLSSQYLADLKQMSTENKPEETTIVTIISLLGQFLNIHFDEYLEEMNIYNFIQGHSGNTLSLSDGQHQFAFTWGDETVGIEIQNETFDFEQLTQNNYPYEAAGTVLQNPLPYFVLAQLWVEQNHNEDTPLEIAETISPEEIKIN